MGGSRREVWLPAIIEGVTFWVGHPTGLQKVCTSMSTIELGPAPKPISKSGWKGTQCLTPLCVSVFTLQLCRALFENEGRKSRGSQLTCCMRAPHVCLETWTILWGCNIRGQGVIWELVMRISNHQPVPTCVHPHSAGSCAKKMGPAGRKP